MQSRTLGKAHNEYEIDCDEAQQVSHDHAVNHDDERSNFFESSAISFEI